MTKDGNTMEIDIADIYCMYKATFVIAGRETSRLQHRSAGIRFYTPALNQVEILGSYY